MRMWKGRESGGMECKCFRGRGLNISQSSGNATQIRKGEGSSSVSREGRVTL